jgi:uncharacterized membrane protein SpoIIM required for sporulation
LDDLSEDELMLLPTLYRQSISSLSVARSISLDQNVVYYLESLCGRAYFYVYGTRQRFRESVRQFFVQYALEAFHRFRWYVLVSGLTLGLGVVIGFTCTMMNLENYYFFISPEYASGRDPGATTKSLHEGLYQVHESKESLVLFASWLFTHNTKVGLYCVALGVLGGLPTIYLLLTNGLLLGAFAALYHTRGLSLDLWGWLLPHGVTELFAVILCGAVGLVIGKAVLIPSEYRRLDQLSVMAKAATPLVVIGALMFFVAGVIEGIFRQTVIDINVRYLVALTTLLGWTLYFGYARIVNQRSAL